MDKQQRIEEVGKYIEKYYIPGYDDIVVDNDEGKGFFHKIKNFFFRKKKRKKESASKMEAPKVPDGIRGKSAPELEAPKVQECFISESAPKMEVSEVQESLLLKETAPTVKAPEVRKRLSRATDLPEYDRTSVVKQRVSRPMRKTTVRNRKIDDLMSQMDETFSKRLIRMIKERNMSESEAYKKAYVDRRHFAKIRKDEYYTPRKKTVLAFAIALELNLDETKDLLRSAGYALSRSSKFDIIVVYFLENRNYNMFDINEALYEYNQPVFE